MIDENAIFKAISPLPPWLRSRIFSLSIREIEEAKAAERSEKEIEREIVKLILQQLFLNLVQPLEMIEEMLESKTLREIGSFKIEFSEVVFDKSFLEKTHEFRSQFWLLVEELGFIKSLRPPKRKLNWKRGHKDELV